MLNEVCVLKHLYSHGKCLEMFSHQSHFWGGARKCSSFLFYSLAFSLKFIVVLKLSTMVGIVCEARKDWAIEKVNPSSWLEMGPFQVGESLAACYLAKMIQTHMEPKWKGKPWICVHGNGRGAVQSHNGEEAWEGLLVSVESSWTRPAC